MRRLMAVAGVMVLLFSVAVFTQPGGERPLVQTNQFSAAYWDLLPSFAPTPNGGPRETPTWWCYPWSPIEPLAKISGPEFGGVVLNAKDIQTPPVKAQIDPYLVAVYRDILRWRVRQVTIWGMSSRSTCSIPLSQGTALLWRYINKGDHYYYFWLSVDHIGYSYDPGWAFDHWQIGGTEAIALPRDPEHKLAIFMTNSPTMDELTLPFRSNYKIDQEARVTNEIYVGERVFVAGTTLIPLTGQRCSKTVRKCLLESMQVVEGKISTFSVDRSAFGAFGFQSDITGGFSGGPVFVVRENDDGKINYKDFYLAGLVQAAWSSGIGTADFVPEDIDERIERFVESMATSLWGEKAEEETKAEAE